MPNTNESMPFVKRFEMAVMQYVILNKASEGEVTRDNLKQSFRGNMQMSSDHFDHCISTLVQDKHLKEVGGNKYAATDDGREDVQKLHTLVMELSNVAGQGGSGKGQGMPQQKSAGQGSSTGMGGSSGAGGASGSPGASGGSSGMVSSSGGGNTSNASGGKMGNVQSGMGSGSAGSTTGNDSNVGASRKGQ